VIAFFVTFFSTKESKGGNPFGFQESNFRVRFIKNMIL
jgi:hypothetical protein